MKKSVVVLSFLSILLLSYKNQPPKRDLDKNNPFFNEFDAPFGIPPFEKIKESHFMPAFKEAMLQEEEDVLAIINNSQEPNFENTIAAFDNKGLLMSKVQSVFSTLTGTCINDTLQKIQKELTPLLTRHGDNIMLNKKLFAKIQQVFLAKDNLNLRTDQLRLLEKIYKRFIRNGAALDSVKQKRLREINEQAAGLSVKFGNNLLAETKAYKLVIDKKEDLAGLPQSLIDAAADDAKKAKMDGKWVFTLDVPSIMPFLTYADNRTLRQQMLTAYSSRGNNNNENDNKKIMAQIFNLRLEKSQLIGYKSYAQFALEERMAKTIEITYDFLNKLWEPALNMAKKECNELQAYIDKQPDKFKLEAWDWRYYSEKVRKEKYALDEEEIRQYLPLDNVRNGAFMVANKLWGITFTPLNNVPTYHKDAVAFEVREKNGKHLGVLYMDFFPRAGKRGGAWCSGFRSQTYRDGKEIRPLVSIVCNFSKPTADAPALLSFDEANTLFHEFGHALRSLLSNVNYSGLNDLVRDYVELPSQIMENWASDPDVLPLYAKHYKTGKPIPKELIKKMTNSQYFNQGFITVEYLAASLLDLDYHSIAQANPDMDVIAFETESMKRIGLIPEILPRYKTTYFNHISGNGYAAGYYVYVWAQVLDADAYQAFVEKGLFDQKTAQLFRENVLAKGSSEDEMTAYKRFRGKEPDIKALLKRKGFDKL